MVAARTQFYLPEPRSASIFFTSVSTFLSLISVFACCSKSISVGTSAAAAGGGVTAALPALPALPVIALPVAALPVGGGAGGGSLSFFDPHAASARVRA